MLAEQPIGKHLHMRGAGEQRRDAAKLSVETSPHAWSRLAKNELIEIITGNISTCVEQTDSHYPTTSHG